MLFSFCLLRNFFIGCQTLWILPYWFLGIFILLSLFLSCVLAHNLVTLKLYDLFKAFVVVFLDKARAVFNLWLMFPHYWGSTLPSTLPDVPYIIRLLHSGWWKSELFLALCQLREWFYFCQWSFPGFR